ncbi:MAG: family 78 glycoside hydrolase catalytic domain [Bacteroidota bacterium]
MRKALIILVLALTYQFSWGQYPHRSISPKLLSHAWPAQWIAHPEVSLLEYSVQHFRNEFSLAETPEQFVVHVSADNRYQFFVNGQLVGRGPARSDLLHYRFESYNIAEYLQAGDNVLAAVVWNFAEDAPVAQHTYRTGLIVQGDTEAEAMVNTNIDNWQVYHNQAYSPLTQADFMVYGYYASGACDRVDGSQYPWGWKTIDYSSNDDWMKPQARVVGRPYGFRYGYGDGAVNLYPRNIPMLEEKTERLAEIERATIVVDDTFLQGNQSVTISAKQQATILLDHTYLTMGYPSLTVSGGMGSKIKVTYAEALYDENRQKGNRNETEGKEIVGFYDIFLPDGGENRIFQPLWVRTFRYLQLDVQTGSEPLTLNDLSHQFTAYPFKQTAFVQADAPTMDSIWDVSWRTARLCALETYMDCPYYEQLQYIGDTRIQALISLYVDGDDRLMRNALFQFANSITDEGITLSRYPSGFPQYIPPYALFWISMLHDYHMHRTGDAFIRQFIPGMTRVLQWYENYLDTNNLLRGMPWWNYVDAIPEFDRGTPPGAQDGHSTLITLQYLYTLQQAVELYRYFDLPDFANHYQRIADRIQPAIQETSYDTSRQLYADTPQQDRFSQHTNIFAVLTQTAPEDEWAPLMQRTVTDTSLASCYIYFRFYLHRAMQQAGLGDYFVDHQDIWKDMLAEGLTTFAEHDEDTRSDCHAWSASPLYEYLATVCGITPSAPHFSEVRIAPNLGYLTEVSAEMPHPQGTIRVDLVRRGNDRIQADIELPEGASGTFYWQGEEVELKSGKQEIKL